MPEPAVLEMGWRAEEMRAAADDQSPPSPKTVPESQPLLVTPRVSLADLASEAMGALTKQQRALSKTMRERGEAVVPAVADVRTTGAEVAKAAGEAPSQPAVAPPPSVKLTDFLAPREGESPLASLTKLIGALGMFATGATGLAHGDARAALASLSGAMQGWHEGDRERADRAFADWQAKQATLTENYKRQRQQWQDVIEAKKASAAEKQQALSLLMLEHGVALDPLKADVEGSKYLLDWIEKKQEHFDRMTLAADQLTNRKEQADAVTQIRQQMADETKRFHDLLIAKDRERAEERVEERARRAAEHRERQDERLVYPQHGGAYYHNRTKRFLTAVEAGDLRRDPEGYRDLAHADLQTLDFLKQGEQALYRLRVLAPRLLAKHPGQNLFQMIALWKQGKLAESEDLRELLALNLPLLVETARIHGGGGQLRVTLLAALRHEVGVRLSDTEQTADRTLQTLLAEFANRRQNILHEPPIPYGSVFGPGSYQMRKGKEEKGIRLKDRELSPEGWEVIRFLGFDR